MRRSLIVLLLGSLGGCVPAAPGSPLPASAAEEHAVWGAAVHALYRDFYPRVPMVVDTLAAPYPRDSYALRALEQGPVGVDAEQVAAFMDPNRPAIRIDPRILTRYAGREIFGARGVPARGDARPGEVLSVRLRLSRVAFDSSHTRALVGVFASCGMLCGNGGIVMLTRDHEGRWKDLRFITSSFAFKRQGDERRQAAD